MNFFRPKPFATVIGRLAAVLAVFIILQARGAEPPAPSRWLLVFDTSSTMKKLQPATQAALRKFFSTSGDGQLQPGDSVAVWLVDQKINGQCPTFAAGATNAGTIVSNLEVFLQRQQYAGASQLALLQSPLDRVVAGSRRLTVILFTDGQSDIVGTPYDDGVNQTFRDVQADRRKNQQPVVVVMRSQMGKFVGCTLGFPPADIGYPPFPEMPAPPAATNAIKATNLPPVRPPVVAPSLVMVGNRVVTNSSTTLEVQAAPTAPVTASNPPSAAATVTNLPASAPTLLTTPAAPPAKVETAPVPQPTNETKAAAIAVPPSALSNLPPPVAAVAPAVPTTPTSNPPVLNDEAPQSLVKPTPPVVATNSAVAATEPPSSQKGTFIYAGLGVLAVAGVIAAVWLGRSRRPNGSLISRSMEEGPRRN